METLERLEQLKEMFKNEDFQTNRGISNQIGIYIFAYPPQDEMQVEYFVKLNKDSNDFHIYEYDLYEEFLAICDEKKILDKIPSLEEKKGSEYVLNQLSKIASPELLISKMKQTQYQKGDIILITGVGKVNPFVRVHALLEKEQNLFPNNPIVVMYPGKYDGHELHLFNKFSANHYRSFNLL